MDERPMRAALAIWACALLTCLLLFPFLLPICLICFAQNVSFTFVSRGRNSGSLLYHLVAALFSNGLYAVMLFLSIDVLTTAKADPAPFVLIYAASCLSGSVLAHWLALRVERGKGAQRGKVEYVTREEFKRELYRQKKRIP